MEQPAAERDERGVLHGQSAVPSPRVPDHDDTPRDDATTVSDVAEFGVRNDPLTDWDPRRRVALERIWSRFEAAGAGRRHLSEELVVERRRQATAEDAELVSE